MPWMLFPKFVSSTILEAISLFRVILILYPLQLMNDTCSESYSAMDFNTIENVLFYFLIMKFTCYLQG